MVRKKGLRPTSWETCDKAVEDHDVETATARSRNQRAKQKLSLEIGLTGSLGSQRMEAWQCQVGKIHTKQAPTYDDQGSKVTK